MGLGWSIAIWLATLPVAYLFFLHAPDDRKAEKSGVLLYTIILFVMVLYAGNSVEFIVISSPTTCLLALTISLVLSFGVLIVARVNPAPRRLRLS